MCGKGHPDLRGVALCRLQCISLHPVRGASGFWGWTAIGDRVVCWDAIEGLMGPWSLGLRQSMTSRRQCARSETTKFMQPSGSKPSWFMLAISECSFSECPLGGGSKMTGRDNDSLVRRARVAFLVLLIGFAGANQAGGHESAASDNYLERNGSRISDYMKIGVVPDEIRSAESISIFFMRPDRWQLMRLDDSRLRKYGCEYKVSDPALVDRLARIVDDAALRVGNFSADEFEPRLLIHRHDSAGGRGVLALGALDSNNPGLLGKVGKIPIVAERAVLPELYEYMAGLPVVERCEGFVRQFR